MEIVSKYYEYKDNDKEKWEVIVWYTLDDLLKVKTGEYTLSDSVVNIIYKQNFSDANFIRGHLESFDVSDHYLFFRIIYFIESKKATG